MGGSAEAAETDHATSESVIDQVKEEWEEQLKQQRLTRPGFFGCSVAGGGGLNQPPPEISAVDRAITMKIGTYVTCGVIYQTIKKKLLKLILY